MTELLSVRAKDFRVFLDPTIGFEQGFRFTANGATIENMTSRYIYFVSAGLYIPPYTFGRTIALPGTNKGQAVWQPPPGITQPAAITGELAWIVFWEDMPVPVLTSASDRVTLAGGTALIGVVSTKTALTPSSPANVSVGVASGAAVAANAARKGLVLVNTSAATISLGLGVAAVLNKGITLNPTGGTWEMDEFTFTVGAVNAIASGAASNLAVQEFTT